MEHGSTGSRTRPDDTAAPVPPAPEDATAPAGEGPGADLTVRLGDLADGFYVEDDGTGIPPERREAVLEPGYSTAPDGTGFGLNIVQRVAEAHGWTLSVTEGSEGGARFEFTGVEFVE